MTKDTPNNVSTSSRRDLLLGTVAVAAALPAATMVSAPADASMKSAKAPSSTVTMADGTSIFVKDWGSGQPVVFSHGWPLTADAWDDQMMFMAENGFRAIAHDRRGHGRSSQRGMVTLWTNMPTTLPP